ncbi:MAG TPA: acyl carrier protein [Alphaproteobacteria bacterium]|nr:acyl carrier protein [Alphaproteobacteria bacterium]
MTTIRDNVVRLIFKACRPHHPDLSDHSRALLDSGLDSLDYTNVLMAVEDHYKIAIADKELDKFGSVDKIVSYLEERVGT